MNNSPLGRLSPEIRNQIYELIFPSPCTIYLDVCGMADAVLHPLTRTCRQLRAETLLMDCANTEIKLLNTGAHKYGDPYGGKTARWLRAMGVDACREIREIDYVVVNTRRLHELAAEWEANGRGKLVRMHEGLGKLPKVELTPWLQAVTCALQELGLRLQCAELQTSNYVTLWKVVVS